MFHCDSDSDSESDSGSGSGSDNDESSRSSSGSQEAQDNNAKLPQTSQKFNKPKQPVSKKRPVNSTSTSTTATATAAKRGTAVTPASTTSKRSNIVELNKRNKHDNFKRYKKTEEQDEFIKTIAIQQQQALEEAAVANAMDMTDCNINSSSLPPASAAVDGDVCLTDTGRVQSSSSSSSSSLLNFSVFAADNQLKFDNLNKLRDNYEDVYKFSCTAESAENNKQLRPLTPYNNNNNNKNSNGNATSSSSCSSSYFTSGGDDSDYDMPAASLTRRKAKESYKSSIPQKILQANAQWRQSGYGDACGNGSSTSYQKKRNTKGFWLRYSDDTKLK